MRDRLQTSRSWFEKARRETDSFDRFISLWVSFNTLYAEYHTRGVGELQAIREFVGHIPERVARNDLAALVALESSRYFCSRIVTDLRKSKDTAEEATVLRSGEFSGVKRAGALFSILYVVLCNLFHGDKRYGQAPDEEIVGKAADVIEVVLSMIHGATA